jgi:Holliday junction resolvasome RuvABC endonuclease subunit
MQKNTRQCKRILGLALSSRAFGYAVYEDEKLVDWGLTSTKQTENVNAWCMTNIIRLFKLYKPDVVALEDVFAKGAARSARVRRLAKQIEAMAANRKARVRKIPKLNMIKAVCGADVATRHDMAEKIAQLFPNELSFRLPKRRGIGDPEDRRIRMFEAVAMALIACGRLLIRKANAIPMTVSLSAQFTER